MRSTSLKFPLPRYASAGSEDKPVRSRLATSLTLAAMSLGYGVVQLDVTIVNTALEQHRHLARRRRLRAAMGGQRLHDRVCGLHPDRRRARRSHRRQAGLHGGLCDLHGGLARMRACARRRDPDRGTRRPGAWRRRSWCRIRWRCSATPIPTRRRADVRSASGRPARASR